MRESKYRSPHRRSPSAQLGSGSEDRVAGASEPDFLIVGRVIRPHGIRGALAMKPLTDYPERLFDVETLYVGEEHHPYRVRRVTGRRERLLVELHGIDDRESAEMLRGELIYVHIRDAVPLEEGEYYLYQIENIRVITDEGEELGRVTGLIETGANDVYIITSPDREGEILIPAIPDVILKVDVDNGVMTVHLLDGLI